MSRKVPEEWRFVPLADFLRESRIAGSDGRYARKITVKLYGNGVIDNNSTKQGSENTKYFKRKSGQFIYSKLDFLNGAFGIIPDKLDGWESTLDLPAFDVLSGIFPDYLLYYVSREDFYSTFADIAKGGRKARRVSPEELLNIKILLPPLSEQQRIIEILGSFGQAIAATQSVIEQTRAVKQGLLKRLLTEGIDHTQFKQTEIGKIPTTWDLVPLEGLLAPIISPMRSGPFGSALKKAELVNDGIPLLGIDNVHVEQFSPKFKRFVSQAKFEELKRYAVRPRDVMITIMGTVGRCCTVPEQIGPALSSKHIWTMTFDQKKYIPELVCWQLNFAPWVISKFSQVAQGGVMEAINSQILKTILLPKPPLAEQIKIFDILQSFNETIRQTEDELGALKQAQSALLSDLLSGRKRVPMAEHAPVG